MAYKRCDSVLDTTPIPDADHDSDKTAPHTSLSRSDHDFAKIAACTPLPETALTPPASPVSSLIDRPRQVRLTHYHLRQTTSRLRKLPFHLCVLRICEVRAVDLGLSMSMWSIVIGSIGDANLARLDLYRLATTGEIFHICHPLELEGALVSMYHEMDTESYILPLFAASSTRLLRQLPLKFRKIDQLRESDFIIKHSQLLTS